MWAQEIPKKYIITRNQQLIKSKKPRADHRKNHDSADTRQKVTLLLIAYFVQY